MKRAEQKGSLFTGIKEMETSGAVRKIGVLGGTFNPIHLGHLIAAEEALNQFSLSRVVFVPAGNPPHKSDDLLDAEDRFLMTLMATAAYPLFSVSRLEMEEDTVSYTYQTMERLQEEEKEAELYFISGADTLLDFHTWKHPERLKKSCRFIVSNRPGYDIGGFLEILEREGRKDLPEIDFMEIPDVAISSSDIRKRIKEGKSIKHLTPGIIEMFIKKQGYYR